MGNLSGQDIVDVMVHGVNTHIKQHIRDRLIEQEVALFKKRIYDISAVTDRKIKVKYNWKIIIKIKIMKKKKK